MRYRLRRKSPRITSTKEVIETRDGDVARLVAIDDKPLSEIDEQREQDRLTALERDPSLQRRRKQSEEGDTGIVLRLVRMLPSAFLYQYIGVAAAPAGPVQKFSFAPNPRFNPPDIETEALRSMTGELWIDAAQERVTRLEGHLRQDTEYGWGVVAKLNKGGWLVLDQADVGGHQWRVVHFQMVMSMRILFKSKNSDTTQDLTGYTPVSGMDYRKAIQMLRAEK